MYGVQQVTGPMPGQYTGQQVTGPTAYYPRETNGFSGIFEMMMPMIMMIMMLAIIMPMLKGITGRE